MIRPRTWGVIATIAVLVGTASYFASQVGRTGTALERRLFEIGFYPVRPPSTLVGPGSIYHVSRDGKFYTTVCKADESIVTRAVQQSPGEQMIARELQKAKYTLDGNPASLINTALNSDVVESVAYALTDVAVLEIPLDKNEEIFVRLTQSEGCRHVVDRLLESREFVCQGQSVLMATVEYQLKTKSGTSIRAALDGESKHLVKAAIEASTDSDIKLDQDRFVSGNGLNYGVKVNPTCVARPGDRYPRYLPRNAYDRMMNFIRLDLLGG